MTTLTPKGAAIKKAKALKNLERAWDAVAELWAQDENCGPSSTFDLIDKAIDSLNKWDSEGFRAENEFSSWRRERQDWVRSQRERRS